MDTKLEFFVIPCATPKFPPATRYFYNELHMETWLDEVGMSRNDVKIGQVAVMIPMPIYLLNDKEEKDKAPLPESLYLANGSFSLTDSFKKSFEPWTRRFDSDEEEELEEEAQGEDEEDDVVSVASSFTIRFADLGLPELDSEGEEEQNEEEEENDDEEELVFYPYNACHSPSCSDPE